MKIGNSINFLKPVKVDDVRPLADKSGKSEKLLGFVLPVTYNGVAHCNKNRLSKMGVLSAGYGSTWKTIEITNNKTVVHYLFREGMLFPEPLGRANKFHDNVVEIVNDFYPVRVSNIEIRYALDLFDELYVSGCSVTVGYPGKLLNNPCFKNVLSHDKVIIQDISYKNGLANVTYLFPNKKNEDIAVVWQRAENFYKNMLARVTEHENIK